MSSEAVKINKPSNLGDILLNWKLITPEKLEIALKEQSSLGRAIKRIGEELAGLGFISEEDFL